MAAIAIGRRIWGLPAVPIYDEYNNGPAATWLPLWEGTVYNTT
jgi:hypothetical protein